jgi:hypothetical protein
MAASSTVVGVVKVVSVTSSVSGASRPWLTAMRGVWLRQVDAECSDAATRHGNSPSARLSVRSSSSVRHSFLGSSRKSVMVFHDENVGDPIWARVCAS